MVDDLDGLEDLKFLITWLIFLADFSEQDRKVVREAIERGSSMFL